MLLSLFAPYTAEESWALLGHEPSVAMAGWPVADPALLVEDEVTCVVQVSGKVRDRLEVPPDISRGRAARAGAGGARDRPGARRPGNLEGDRPGSQAGEHRSGSRLTAAGQAEPAAHGAAARARRRVSRIAGQGRGELGRALGEPGPPGGVVAK